MGREGNLEVIARLRESESEGAEEQMGIPEKARPWER